jgi:hypothetical protein
MLAGKFSSEPVACFVDRDPFARQRDRGVFLNRGKQGMEHAIDG